MKKGLAFLMAVLMLLCIMPTMGFAASKQYVALQPYIEIDGKRVVLTEKDTVYVTVDHELSFDFQLVDEFGIVSDTEAPGSYEYLDSWDVSLELADASLGYANNYRGDFGIEGLNPGKTILNYRCVTPGHYGWGIGGSYDFSGSFNVVVLPEIVVQEKATVNSGETVKVGARLSPVTNNKIVWKSLDPGIATVDANGVVTGVRGGTATIRAQVENKFGAYQDCTVTVRQSPTAVYLDTASKKIAPGEEFLTEVQVDPINAYDDTVVWSSSNPSVASVDKYSVYYEYDRNTLYGYVHAKKAGTAVIKATTVNGLTATCKVTVETAKPGKPASVKATSAGYNSIKLSWKKGKSISGYEIERSTKKSSGFKKIGTASSSATSYIDKKGLTTGKQYYYRVRAYKTKGKTKIYSAYSTVINTKAVPAKPGLSLKKASATSIKASWKVISGVSGYEVQMSTKKTSGFKTNATIKNGKTVSSTLKKLKRGKTYYIRVRAYKTVSGKKIYGSWSDVKSIKLK